MSFREPTKPGIRGNESRTLTPQTPIQTDGTLPSIRLTQGWETPRNVSTAENCLTQQLAPVINRALKLLDREPVEHQFVHATFLAEALAEVGLYIQAHFIVERVWAKYGDNHKNLQKEFLKLEDIEEFLSLLVKLGHDKIALEYGTAFFNDQECNLSIRETIAAALISEGKLDQVSQYIPDFSKAMYVGYEESFGQALLSAAKSGESTEKLVSYTLEHIHSPNSRIMWLARAAKTLSDSKADGTPLLVTALQMLESEDTSRKFKLREFVAQQAIEMRALGVAVAALQPLSGSEKQNSISLVRLGLAFGFAGKTERGKALYRAGSKEEQERTRVESIAAFDEKGLFRGVSPKHGFYLEEIRQVANISAAHCIDSQVEWFQNWLNKVTMDRIITGREIPRKFYLKLTEIRHYIAMNLSLNHHPEKAEIVMRDCLPLRYPSDEFEMINSSWSAVIGSYIKTYQHTGIVGPEAERLHHMMKHASWSTQGTSAGVPLKSIDYLSVTIDIAFMFTMQGDTSRALHEAEAVEHQIQLRLLEFSRSSDTQGISEGEEDEMLHLEYMLKDIAALRVISGEGEFALEQLQKIPIVDCTLGAYMDIINTIKDRNYHV